MAPENKVSYSISLLAGVALVLSLLILDFQDYRGQDTLLSLAMFLHCSI